MLDLKALLAKILDALKVDYIIEEGTATPDSYGTWTYRKWRSGVAECWRPLSSASFAPTASVGGFYGRVLATYLFPTNLFSTRPYSVFVNIDSWGTGYFWGQARSVSRTSYQVALWRNDNASSVMTGGVYAIGFWKTFTGGVINLIKHYITQLNIFSFERGCVVC